MTVAEWSAAASLAVGVRGASMGEDAEEEVAAQGADATAAQSVEGRQVGATEVAPLVVVAELEEGEEEEASEEVPVVVATEAAASVAATVVAAQPVAMMEENEVAVTMVAHTEAARGVAVATTGAETTVEDALAAVTPEAAEAAPPVVRTVEAVTVAEWSAAPSLKRVEIPAETLEVVEQARDESTG